MHGRNTAGTAWLSLTPKPERNLPELLALLGQSWHVEEHRMSRIVLRGRSRRWLRYLSRATSIALVDLDDWGYAGLLGDGAVAGDHQSQAREAASVCPVAALEVQQ